MYTGYVSIATSGGPQLRRPSQTGLFDLYPTPDSVLAIMPPIRNDIPAKYILEQNFPNPFNAGTWVFFRMPRAEYVELSLFTLLGQRVRTIFSGVAVPGANPPHHVDAIDDNGRSLPTGMYVLRLTGRFGSVARKMMLVK
jgi:hypothetical protein